MEEKKKKPHIIATASHKGGAGKTSTIVNLAYEFSALGLKTLVIDFDYQGSASSWLGVLQEAEAEEISLGYALKNKEPLSSVILKTSFPNIWVAPSGEPLKEFLQQQIKWDHGAKFLLRDLMKDDSDLDSYGFDVVLVDTRPDHGPLSRSGVTIADRVIVVGGANPDTAIGAVETQKLYEMAMEDNPRLKHLGILFNGIITSDRDHQSQMNLMKSIAKGLGVPILDVVIPYSPQVLKARIKRRPVGHLHKGIPVSRAYRAAVRDIVESIN